MWFEPWLFSTARDADYDNQVVQQCESCAALAATREVLVVAELVPNWRLARASSEATQRSAAWSDRRRRAGQPAAQSGRDRRWSPSPAEWLLRGGSAEQPAAPVTSAETSGGHRGLNMGNSHYRLLALEESLNSQEPGKTRAI